MVNRKYFKKGNQIIFMFRKKQRKLTRQVEKHKAGKYFCGKVYLPKEWVGDTVDIINRRKGDA